MADRDSSKSQDRLMSLLSLTADGTYEMAGRVLEAAGMPKDGLPTGETWRTAGKLSDAELLAALPIPKTAVAPVPTTAEVREARVQLGLDRREAYRERRRTNDLLRQHGYRWSKVPMPGANNPSPLMDDWDEAWTLVSPDGREVTVGQAKREIGY